MFKANKHNRICSRQIKKRDIFNANKHKEIFWKQINRSLCKYFWLNIAAKTIPNACVPKKKKNKKQIMLLTSLSIF